MLQGSCRKRISKFLKFFLHSQKRFLPLQPVSERTEVHWKNRKNKYKQVPILTWLKSEEQSVDFFKEIESCRVRLESYIKLYNEEFDPGSGWTLAAGLTHASRGAAGRSNTMPATGARVRNAWAICPYQGDKRWKRRLIPHNRWWGIPLFWKLRWIRMSSRDIS